ncbi:hypothetical protein MF271_19445 (plasmid) [Deinococcus sp. KNUC1210]|uniref:hypothetical protein n=1 Tax=Deinococcus sp. KNUC1210 TaxID=2917691 RepID=UPI001EF13CD5|nr:hypothetical protein [Deinococcus sp. KNUC1210]ULH17367.1 hypothetical protein MF271_19445 [Deinococcus sp. KNUC1210]
MASAPSLPDTYRLLAVFSGIPLDPLEALGRARLATVDEQGRLCYTLHARNVLSILVERRQIIWKKWDANKDGTGIPAGYVLTGVGEADLACYFDLYGPAWPGGRPS